MSKAADQHPPCPECETNLMVDATNLAGAFRCHACDETFGPTRRPVAWDAPDAWYVSGSHRGRRKAHADRDCPDLARANSVLEWSVHNVRAAELGRCKRCSHEVVGE